MTILKTSDIVKFTADLLMTLYKGSTYVSKEKAMDSRDLQKTKDNQRTVNWQPYIGIGMMVIGGAVLVLGRKNSATN
jgi:hypothetical protein